MECTSSGGTTDRCSSAILPTAADAHRQWTAYGTAPSGFRGGTLVATPGGEQAIETLKIGDLVLTADGGPMPVRWVGRSVLRQQTAEPPAAPPVRIRAGALDRNIPARDLVVASTLAVRICDLLVQAGALVNGVSVVREDAPLATACYQLELDTHSLLLAEGAAAESFLDGVEPSGFDNWHERQAPADVLELPLPRIRSARQLARAVREHMAARIDALRAETTDGPAVAAASGTPQAAAAPESAPHAAILRLLLAGLACSGHDLTARQFAAFLTVYMADGPLTLAALASSLGVSPAGASQITDRLVRLDLLGREEDQDDRRRVRIRQTPRGADLFRQMADVAQGGATARESAAA